LYLKKNRRGTNLSLFSVRIPLDPVSRRRVLPAPPEEAHAAHPSSSSSPPSSPAKPPLSSAGGVIAYDVQKVKLYSGDNNSTMRLSKDNLPSIVPIQTIQVGGGKGSSGRNWEYDSRGSGAGAAVRVDKSPPSVHPQLLSLNVSK